MGERTGWLVLSPVLWRGYWTCRGGIALGTGREFLALASC
jgi:hypothetical protein